MATNTFNVKELEPIYAMIEENSNRISMKSNQIVSLCDQLAQLIKSTDSTLSTSYIKVAEAITTAKGKVLDLLNQLEDEMKTYASNTLANEQETESKLKEINANIEDIAAIFNSIANKNA